jgi:hypothetical protein
VFRTDVERRSLARARRWTNLGLTPPGKLARYGNTGEGSSYSQSSRAPVVDSSDDADLVPARSPTISSKDYAHGIDEEEAVLAQTKAVSEAEARARFRREESARSVNTRRPAGRPASAA